MAGDEDLAGALQDTASVESSYQKAIDGEPDGAGSEEDGEDGEDRRGDEDAGGTGHHADDDMAWVDTFILNARRKGGQQTEMSVRKTYDVSNRGLVRRPSPSFKLI